MLSFAILALLAFLVVLLFLSIVVRRLKTIMPGFDEPIRIPARMGWSLGLAAAALNVFAYDVEFGIGFGLFGACVIGAIFLLFPPEKRGREVWFPGVTGIVACLLFGFRANEFVQAVNVATAIVCAGILILLRSVETLRWHGLWFLKMKAGFLARLMHYPLLIRTFLQPPRAKEDRALLTTLTTLALTFIVLLFFSWLLSSADPVFDNLVRTVRDQALGRAFFSGILIALLLAGLTVSVPKKWQENIPQFKALGFLEMFVPTLSLVLLFGLFLGIQAKYLFGSHADFQALNITYSEYVRKGFIELLIASFAGSIISYALILKQHALSDAKKVLQLKWLNGVLLIELLLLLLSAGKRDWMYTETYGLTRVRIIGALFLFWLFTIIALIIALNVFRAMNERKLWTGAALVSALVVLILNAVNIDDQIAFSRPPRGERPDVVYMSRLSSDAVEGWLSALIESSSRYDSLRTKTVFTEQERSELADAKIALFLLERKFRDIALSRSWQEWNWSKSKALRRINNGSLSSPQLLADCLIKGIRELQYVTQTNLFEQEERRIHDYVSPFIFSDMRYQPESLEWMDVPHLERSSGSGVPRTCKLDDPLGLNAL